jgi:hypothetical protein
VRCEPHGQELSQRSHREGQDAPGRPLRAIRRCFCRSRGREVRGEEGGQAGAVYGPPAGWIVPPDRPVPLASFVCMALSPQICRLAFQVHNDPQPKAARRARKAAIKTDAAGLCLFRFEQMEVSAQPSPKIADASMKVGFPYSTLLPAKKPTLRAGTDSHSVTKSEFWRFAIRAQGCCAHASTDVHLSGGMGWKVRSRGRSRWHDSSLRGWISQTGVG